MAYIKKYNYPSLRKPGVYPPSSVKERGLNTDNLEKFSLGNWNSIEKNNRKFFTSRTDILDRIYDSSTDSYLGRPTYMRPALGGNPFGGAYLFQQTIIYKNNKTVVKLLISINKN